MQIQGIHEVIEHVRKNLRVNNKLPELGNLSVPHFSVLFRKQTGTSPIRFITRLRIQKACELLDTTNFPISEISTQVGFANQLYFCRQFKQQIGIAASQYRKIT